MKLIFDKQAKGPTGSVNNGQTGISFKIDENISGSVNVIPGDKDANLITGSSFDDIVLSGGAGQSHKEADARLRQAEAITGKDGYDTVIIPGHRADWKIELPGAVDYPDINAKEIWEKHETLYGSSINLTHYQTGDRMRLNGVESVVFDNNSALQDVRGAVQSPGLKKAIENGDAEQVTVKELIATAEHDLRNDPENLHAHKAFATREAAQIVKDTFVYSGNEDDIAQRIKVVDEAVRAANIKVDGLEPYKPDAPKAPELLKQGFGINPAPSPSGG